MDEIFKQVLGVVDQHRQVYAAERDDLMHRGKATAVVWRDFVRVCDSIEQGIKALEPDPSYERLKTERDAYKLACERAGVCMSCVVQAPETYGCPDCMNTGWQQGDPYERIKQLEAPITTELGPDGKERAKTSAGFDHVEAVKPRADGWHGLSPWFHGWAVREAFVAGAEWQEKRRLK